MTFRFYYGDLFKRDVNADSYIGALHVLSNSTDADVKFGIHPLLFTYYDII